MTFTEIDPTGTWILGQTNQGGSFVWHRVEKTLTNDSIAPGFLHKTKCGRRHPGKTAEVTVGHTTCATCED